ncbi:Uu.00g040820.m01.CDS01 [Anthostomella pinea]|uniref:Uu.00g040820.m01.CDS01 n=1 Tax=Anthostomella pinea TaxID=933095 RepID=A0AAI8VA90_9PEZI|nr:Uu.00g040820.m01.CDS01 [Anthostomella pinea]
MADLLTPVSQTYRKQAHNEEFLSVSKPAEPATAPTLEFNGTSPEEALEVLKSQPSYDTLLCVLKYLQKGTRGKQAFDIRIPGPRCAQIIHVLVTEIVPNYSTLLRESSEGQSGGALDVLLACLTSLTGINAALTYIRALTREAKSDPKGFKNPHVVFNLSFTLDLLGRLLQADGGLKQLWSSISPVDNAVQVRPMRQEFISLLASGRISSFSAEAEDLCRQQSKLDEEVWVANGKRYVDWLGHGLVTWIRHGVSEEDIKLAAEVAARAMRLPHSENLIKTLFTELLLRGAGNQTTFGELLGYFPPLQQRKVLLIILKLLSNLYLGSADSSEGTDDDPIISAVAGALRDVIAKDENQKDYLISWLTGASGAGLGESCGIRRAAVAVLADDKVAISTVLEKSLNQFGDQLYIRHSPMLQQEAHAQVLLLSAGYTHRIAPIKLTVLLRSSAYLNTVSNRIAASQGRGRFLGMVVGEALSGLVHGKETKLDFKMDELDTSEAKWYKALVHVSDKIGPLNPLRALLSPSTTSKAPRPAKQAEKVAPKLSRAPRQSGFAIEEIKDDEEQDDPELIPYAKPDSDAEDSDDDPTLISRDKPKAPVYIRDLISYLRDTETYDKQKLALATAPTLIRRKATYGTEVTSHAEELAALLVGLQDKFDLDAFHDQRLQGMIAIVVAQPKKMGQWFAKTFFDGDYSFSQRASILIVLGLSGREIAGFETSEYATAAQFPSKALPTRVEKHYIPPSSSSTGRLQTPGSNLKALPPNAVDKLAQSLSQTFLAPLAAEAADAATGPDALKLSSFTSRLNAQSSNSSKGGSKARTRGVRSIPNTTASLIASSFFFPLTSRFQAAMASSSREIIFQPYLLAVYLKTLALLLHAAGPSTLALPQMTAELWDLLLGVRAQCLGEQGVTQAVLFALIALLDVNEGDMRGLCERQGREVVESMEWVGGVFNNTRGGDAGGDGEENEVKMLAAGVLIRLREAVDKYQAVLMGDLIGLT